jgi:hypothetical protein
MTYYLNLEGRMKVNSDWWSSDAEKFRLSPSYVNHLRHLLVQSETLLHRGKKQWPLFRVTDLLHDFCEMNTCQYSDVTLLHIPQLPWQLHPHSGFPLQPCLSRENVFRAAVNSHYEFVLNSLPAIKSDVSVHGTCSVRISAETLSNLRGFP